MVCDANEGNVKVPAVPGAVSVDSKVAVEELNVDEVEYQHLRFVKSAVA